MLIQASSMPIVLPPWRRSPAVAILVVALGWMAASPFVFAGDDPGGKEVHSGATQANLRVPSSETCPPPFPFSLDLPDEWDSVRKSFQEARCDGIEGRLAEAESGFSALIETRPTLAAFWRWHLIRTHVLAGDFPKALAYFEDFFASHPGEELRARLRDLVWTHAGNDTVLPAETRAMVLDGYLSQAKIGPEDHRLKLALLQLARARGEEGVEHRLALQLWAFPKDKAAAETWSKYPQPREGGRPVPTGPEIVSRARGLFKLRLFKQLATELETLSLPLEDPHSAKILGRLYFRALIRSRSLARAAVQIHTPSVIKRFSFDDRQQLIWAIRIQLRRKKIGSVLKFLEELESRFPGDGELPEIYLELLQYNRGRGDQVTMKHWFGKILKADAGSQTASDAQWFMVWDAIRGKDFDTATRRIDSAWPQAESYHPVDQARLQYWKGRLLILGEDRDGGVKVWDQLIERWPYGYYSVLVDRDRNGHPPTLRPLPNTESESPAPKPPLIEHLWETAPFPEGLFLFSVGDGPLAVEMLEEVMGRKFSDEVIEEAAQLFQFLNRHHLLLRLMANHRLTRLRTLQVAKTPLWKRAYPRSHWEMVSSVAREHMVDPYFIMSIMREESRFSARANSVAGARGLMQLMPATARGVAKRNGLPYEEDMLHLPELNIPLGTLYLKRVLKRFQGNIIFASAAYNAGPTTVRRWLKKFGKVPLDEFVERIPYEETQNYVKRVVLSYHIYRAIYELSADPSLTAGAGVNHSQD